MTFVAVLFMVLVPLSVFASYHLNRAPFGSRVLISRTTMAKRKRPSVSKASIRLKETRHGAGAENDSSASNEVMVSKFLLKSEPSEFSIEQLRDNTPDQTIDWDGIRSHEAKNNLLSMANGDQCFFYHSSCKIPGIVGIVTVVREAQTDLTALDPTHANYDPKCQDESKCPWVAVRVKLDRVFPTVITLQQLKEAAKETPSGPIAQMTFLRRSRLSVSRVTDEQWNAILDLICASEIKMDS